MGAEISGIDLRSYWMGLTGCEWSETHKGGIKKTLGVHDLQLARHEARIAKFLLSHLPLTHTSLYVRAERHLPAGHVVIAGDFNGDHFFAELGDLDDLVEMPAVVADPLAREVEARYRLLGCRCCLSHLPDMCHTAGRLQSPPAMFSTERLLRTLRIEH